jgi:hypothetical protein
MKKRFAWFGAVAIALVSFCLAVFLGGNPSDAVSNKYKALISAGVIDAVVEPSELGLDYLREQPMELASDNALLGAIRGANAALAVMPEDMPLGIPLGQNKPIAIGRLNDGGRSESSKFGENPIAVAVVASNGDAQNVTPSGGGKMTNAEAANGGNLPNPDEGVVGDMGIPVLFSQMESRILLADASRSFKMAKRVPVIDLIVSRKKNGARRNYLVRNVNANAFCRDLVNATLNKNLIRTRGVA